ncbi:hypothetical protein [Paractinoplanes durhamensis]|nr:hypothetical protein [Actinoplanes durhamensis]
MRRWRGHAIIEQYVTAVLRSGHYSPVRMRRWLQRTPAHIYRVRWPWHYQLVLLGETSLYAYRWVLLPGFLAGLTLAGVAVPLTVELLHAAGSPPRSST